VCAGVLRCHAVPSCRAVLHSAGSANSPAQRHRPAWQRAQLTCSQYGGSITDSRMAGWGPPLEMSLLMVCMSDLASVGAPWGLLLAGAGSGAVSTTAARASACGWGCGRRQMAGVCVFGKHPGACSASCGYMGAQKAVCAWYTMPQRSPCSCCSRGRVLRAVRRCCSCSGGAGAPQLPSAPLWTHSGARERRRSRRPAGSRACWAAAFLLAEDGEGQ
jgi:hypothetical protein